MPAQGQIFVPKWLLDCHCFISSSLAFEEEEVAINDGETVHDVSRKGHFSVRSFVDEGDSLKAVDWTHMTYFLGGHGGSEKME